MGNTIDINKTFSAEEFTSLQIMSSFTNITVRTGKDDTAHIECVNVPDSSEVFAENGRLTVDVRAKGLLNRLLIDPLKNAGCTITLPEKMLESFTASIGAGNTVLDGISCASAKLNTGAGNLTAGSITFKESMSLDTGAGNVTMNDVHGGELTVRTGTGNFTADGELDSLSTKSGTGNIRFDGTVQGEVSIKGGIGDSNLMLHNKPANVRTETGIGKVNINYV